MPYLTQALQNIFKKGCVSCLQGDILLDIYNGGSFPSKSL